jgi:DNA-binding transcriptional regulator YdaS (Cro superfamily)
MNLLDYLKSLDAAAQKSFADRCQTSVQYLFQVARGERKPKFDLAVRVDRESGGAVVYRKLLPNVDWSYVRHRERSQVAEKRSVAGAERG